MDSKIKILGYRRSCGATFENFDFFRFLGGTPRTGPLKISKFQIFQKWPNMTSYNPIFLLQNQLVLWKLRCLQKTRAQNIEIWPNGGHFPKKKNFWDCQKNFFEKFISRPFLNFFWIFFGFWLVGYRFKCMYYRIGI